MREIRKLHPGQRLSATEFNRLSKAVAAQAKISADTPAQMSVSSAGRFFTVPQPGFWARITDFDMSTLAYSFVESVPADETGVMVDLPDGRFGILNAFEVNANQANIDDIVWLERGKYNVGDSGNQWLFVIGGASGTGQTITYVSDVTLDDCILNVTYDTFTTTTLDSLSQGLDDLGGLTGFY